MLNLNEALAVIYAAHEIEEMKETLSNRLPVSTDLIVELQDKVSAAGNYAAFARYKQGPAYSWFYNMYRQVTGLAKAYDDRYSPSPVRKGEDPTNSKDDRKFDKAFEEDELAPHMLLATRIKIEREREEMELENLLLDSGMEFSEDDLDAFSNLTLPEIKRLISIRKRRQLLKLKAKATEDLEKLWAARDRELAEHDTNSHLIEYSNGDIRCSCGCNIV